MGFEDGLKRGLGIYPNKLKAEENAANDLRNRLALRRELQIVELIPHKPIVNCFSVLARGFPAYEGARSDYQLAHVNIKYHEGYEKLEISIDEEWLGNDLSFKFHRAASVDEAEEKIGAMLGIFLQRRGK